MRITKIQDAIRSECDNEYILHKNPKSQKCIIHCTKSARNSKIRNIEYGDICQTINIDHNKKRLQISSIILKILHYA